MPLSGVLAQPLISLAHRRRDVELEPQVEVATRANQRRATVAAALRFAALTTSSAA